MRHDEFSSKTFADYLRDRAREEAEEDEFHPEEHTFWLTADRLEDLEEVITCLDEDGAPSPEAVASLLERVAGSIRWGKYHHTFKD